MKKCDEQKITFLRKLCIISFCVCVHHKPFFAASFKCGYHTFEYFTSKKSSKLKSIIIYAVINRSKIIIPIYFDKSILTLCKFFLLIYFYAKISFKSLMHITAHNSNEQGKNEELEEKNTYIHYTN